MTALTADRLDSIRTNGARKHDLLALTAQTFFFGQMVMVNASGLVVPAADAVGGKMVTYYRGPGLVSTATTRLETYDFVIVPFDIDAASLVQADIGKNVFVKDDQTVTDAAGATNDIKVGRLVAINSAGKAEVEVGVFSLVDA